MDRADDDPDEEAIAWALRLPHADAAAWLQFTLWLERDPRNAQAYDRASRVGADLASPAPRSPAAHRARPRPMRRYWRPAAVAAAMIAVVGGALLVPRHRTPVLVLATQVGERRSFPLGDGSRVTLAGGTRLEVSRAEPRRARLLAGSALFHVVHDRGHAFRVLLGDDSVVDIGTDFVLSRMGGTNEVAVIDGAVLYDPARQRLTLGAGDRIVHPDGSGAAVRSHLRPASIAQWANGSLTFRDAAVTEVASELTRATGLTVTVAPSLAGHHFTGRIALPNDGMDALRRRVAALLGVEVTPSAAGWRLLPAGRALR